MENKFSWKSFIVGVVATCLIISPHRALECAVSQSVATYRNVMQSFEPPINGHSARLAANIEAFATDLAEMEASMKEVDERGAKKSRK